MNTKHIYSDDITAIKTITGIPAGMAWRIDIKAGQHAEINLPWPDGSETCHLLRDDGGNWAKSHKVVSREDGFVNVEESTS